MINEFKFNLMIGSILNWELNARKTCEENIHARADIPPPHTTDVQDAAGEPSHFNNIPHLHSPSTPLTHISSQYQ